MQFNVGRVGVVIGQIDLLREGSEINTRKTF